MSLCVAPEGDWELLVQAGHDGELDAGDVLRVARHVRGCAHCAAWQAELGRLSARLRAEVPVEAAPAGMRRVMIVQAAGGGVPEAVGRRPRRLAVLGGGLVGAALAASLMLALLPGLDAGDEAVSGHIRALQPGHLVDVVSTDRHTVKPWFEGRLDFAPPVRDLSAQGFVLEGGRLDYVGGRAVAALVYRRGKHEASLFVWPDVRTAAPEVRTMRGYNVLSWAEGGMALRLVSDVEAADLMVFARAWRSAPANE